MARVLAVSLVLVSGAAALETQPPIDVVTTQHQLEFRSAFWPNLHNLLWAEAWGRRPVKDGEPSPAGRLPDALPTSITPAERKAWDDAVGFYDREIADLHPLFDAGSAAIRKALLEAGTDIPAAGLTDAHRSALMQAAPVYRAHLWPRHDRANREWIETALAKLATLAPAIIERLSTLYEAKWFSRP